MKAKISDYPEGAGGRDAVVEIVPDDLIGLDSTLAKIIAPCLKAFSDFTNCSPVRSDGTDMEEGEWQSILSKMQHAFALLSDDCLCSTKEQDTEIQEGLDLFAKWYRHLWD